MTRPKNIITFQEDQNQYTLYSLQERQVTSPLIIHRQLLIASEETTTPSSIDKRRQRDEAGKCEDPRVGINILSNRTGEKYPFFDETCRVGDVKVFSTRDGGCQEKEDREIRQQNMR